MDAPLCKHRLAVMYITRWEQDQHRRYAPSSPPDARDEAAQGAPQPPYVTIAPPSHSKEGWRWVYVRRPGQLNRHSTQEFPTPQAALKAAEAVAVGYNIPVVPPTEAGR